ncbi:MAG TPA: tetratricopeptide repeat protein, partial [Chthonomonadaceae bacterium]|nr:tetratricopeptide repeat protein [Chthonomonadaceae bacterium]
SVVWTLLQRVPCLHCLVTSRQPLSLPGEQAIPVLPLPIPTLEEPAPASSLLTTHLLTYPSVALFVDRAQAARSDFQITPGNALQIAAICQKLEGIPLAIELAAARARTLTLTQILERLSERFELLASRKGDKGERHRSLWAAIDWSYHLLAPDLKRFFARLSVFRDGWRLEAAEAVCEEPLALDYLSQLRAYSLILAEESPETIRFRMLETLREFAGEVLPPDDRASLSDRHRDHFLRFAEEAEKAFFSADQARWLQLLEQEHENMRASLRWCQMNTDSQEAGLRLAGSLWRFWDMGGYWSEGRKHLQSLLSHGAARAKTPARAKALHGAASLAMRLGDYAAARTLFEQSLAIEQELGDKKSLAASLNGLGNVAVNQGDYAAARLLYEQSLTMARETGDKKVVALSLGNLGHLLYLQSDYAGARALHEQSLAMERELGDRWGIAFTLHGLGALAADEGDPAAARDLYAESLDIRREIGDRWGTALSLHNLGSLAQQRGDFKAARDLYAESLSIRREIGDKRDIAYSLEALAEITARQEQAEVAARLWAAAKALREAIGSSLPPKDTVACDRLVAEAQTVLGEPAFSAAWEQGQAMTLEQAIAYALQEDRRRA